MNEKTILKLLSESGIEIVRLDEDFGLEVVSNDFEYLGISGGHKKFYIELKGFFDENAVDDLVSELARAKVLIELANKYLFN